MRVWRRLFARVAPRLFLRLLRPTSAELGRIGELLAARYLAGSGLRVVGRRLETAAAEIDLVCRDGDVWVCVEVKAGRAGPRFRPGHRVDRRRLARLLRAARDLARKSGRRARVDLVEVLLDEAGVFRGLEHHVDLRHPLP